MSATLPPVEHVPCIYSRCPYPAYTNAVTLYVETANGDGLGSVSVAAGICDRHAKPALKAFSRAFGAEALVRAPILPL